uniref:Uncharacterized protein n=1 Tax=Setaria viridis TaxID=4556 RepID=A0A4U6W812_SETVI|nr:hypothetical protein SEVIR_1G140300v2 [Setaria viridis]
MIHPRSLDLHCAPPAPAVHAHPIRSGKDGQRGTSAAFPSLHHVINASSCRGGWRSASPRSQPRSPRLRSPSDGPADLISPSNGARGKRPGAACARSPPGRGREGRGEADKS